MALVLLALCLLLVVPFTEVMGTEFIGSPNIDQWQRVLDRKAPTNCNGASAGDKVTDPNNCHNFFVCTGDGDMLPDSLPCGDAFLCFNEVGQCSNDPAECTDTDKPCENEVTCVTKCGAPATFVYNTDDCSKYSICITDNDPDPIPVDCKETGPGPYFNGHTCGNDESACCNCQLENCVNEGAFIADPTNCHAYYVCVNLDGTDNGPLSHVGPKICTEKGSFDPDIGDCVSDTKCVTPCPPGGGGSTTPTSISTTPTSTSSKATSTSSTATSNPTTPASTSTKPTTVRTSTTDDGCIDLVDFPCLDHGHGNYAHCTFCDPSYIHCDNAASTPKLEYCLEGKVYNTNPDYPGCILPKNCPFPY